MYLNTMINQIYWNAWKKLSAAKETFQEECGAEAVEWIALVAVLVLLLMGLWKVVGDQREGLSKNIICGVQTWVSDAFGSKETASFENTKTCLAG